MSSLVVILFATLAQPPILAAIKDAHAKFQDLEFVYDVTTGDLNDAGSDWKTAPRTSTRSARYVSSGELSFERIITLVTAERYQLIDVRAPGANPKRLTISSRRDSPIDQTILRNDDAVSARLSNRDPDDFTRYTVLPNLVSLPPELISDAIHEGEAVVDGFKCQVVLFPKLKSRGWFCLDRNGCALRWEEYVADGFKTLHYRLTNVKLCELRDASAAVYWAVESAHFDWHFGRDSKTNQRQYGLPIPVKRWRYMLVRPSVRFNAGLRASDVAFEFNPSRLISREDQRGQPRGSLTAPGADDPLPPLKSSWAAGGVVQPSESPFAFSPSTLVVLLVAGAALIALAVWARRDAHRRKYMGRVAWLLAWGAWAALGVGLHRHLPRNVGPVVAKLQMPTIENVVGFLPSGEEIATLQNIPSQPSAIYIYKAATGERVRTIMGPATGQLVDVGFGSSKDREDIRRFGLLLSNVSTKFDSSRDSNGNRETGFHILDLRTGAVRKVQQEWAEFAAFHPQKPWLLFTSRRRPQWADLRVQVLDVERDIVLFDKSVSAADPLSGDPFFDLGSDAVVFPLRSSKTNRRTQAGRFEFWTVANPSQLTRTVDPAFVGMNGQPSLGGRVAFSRAGSYETYIDVVDLRDGKRLFAYPADDDRNSYPQYRFHPPAVLSASGRAALQSGRYGMLWDVDTGKLLWRGSSAELVTALPLENKFAVYEPWSVLFKSWSFLKGYATFAVRDLETGAVEYRCPVDQMRTFGATSPDGSLSVGRDGLVTRMPFHVNWPLLAACQGVLALPLILFWSALRLRRRWRTRALRNAAG